jgi:hypothetical protein
MTHTLIVRTLLLSALAITTTPVSMLGLPENPKVERGSGDSVSSIQEGYPLVLGGSPNQTNRADEAVDLEARPVTPAASHIQGSDTQEGDCQERTEQVYSAVLERVQSRSELSIKQIKEEVRQSELVGKRRFFGIEVLDGRPQPTLLIWYTCPVTATSGYSSFRIYKFASNRYRLVTRSEQFPSMEHTDRYGQRLDQGLLEVEKLPGSSRNGTFFLTRWTVGGSSPPITSAVVWQWNGEKLKSIWERFKLRMSVEVLGRVIRCSVLENEDEVRDKRERAQWRDEMYRVEKGGLVSDGLLDRVLAERYLREGVITPDSAKALAEWADVFRGFGDDVTAIQLFEQAVKADRSYLIPYFALSRLYEKLENYEKAAEWTRRLADVAGGLSEEGKRHMNELERKARGEP